MMHHVLGGYFKLPSYSDFAEDMMHHVPTFWYTSINYADT